MTGPLAVLDEHLAAFNEHDTARLLAGLSADAVWVTGRDTFRGEAELAGLFDAGLWALEPHLELRSCVVSDDAVAAELTETLVLDGERRVFGIAVFLRVTDGSIHAAKVYREGSADL